ncbi:hypothetical protein B296_00009374, partial [Ensete ventricosum]
FKLEKRAWSSVIHLLASLREVGISRFATGASIEVPIVEVREQKSVHDTFKTPQPMIIPARELVQVLAKDEEMDLHFLADKDLGLSSVDHNTELMSNSISWSSPSLDVDIRFVLLLDTNQIKDQGGKECMAIQESRASDEVDLCLLINILHVADKHLSTESEGLSISATLSDPSSFSQGNIITEPSDSPVLGKLPAASKPIDPPIRHGGFMEHACADSALSHPRLSPSSSCGSLSSDKSTLNPNAKEFKLNPNAKSFTPLSSMRLHTAVSDGSIYYPSNATAVPHMHGLPIGVGVGPSFGHQPVLYNPQAPPMQSSQAYVHPSGPMSFSSSFAVWTADDCWAASTILLCAELSTCK